MHGIFNYPDGLRLVTFPPHDHSAKLHIPLYEFCRTLGFARENQLTIVATFQPIPNLSTPCHSTAYSPQRSPQDLSP